MYVHRIFKMALVIHPLRTRTYIYPFAYTIRVALIGGLQRAIAPTRPFPSPVIYPSRPPRTCGFGEKRRKWRAIPQHISMFWNGTLRVTGVVLGRC